MLIFPPASVLVASALAVALISAPSPIVNVSELMLMSPAFPALLVSVVRLVPVCRLNVLVLIAIAPAFPSPTVDAEIDTLSDVVKSWVSILMLPALPVPVVSTEIFPSPEISIVSGALILIFPPLPIDVVRAEIKPWLLKFISKSGVSL